MSTFPKCLSFQLSFSGFDFTFLIRLSLLHSKYCKLCPWDAQTHFLMCSTIDDAPESERCRRSCGQSPGRGARLEPWHLFLESTRRWPPGASSHLWEQPGTIIVKWVKNMHAGQEVTSETHPAALGRCRFCLHLPRWTLGFHRSPARQAEKQEKKQVLLRSRQVRAALW